MLSLDGLNKKIDSWNTVKSKVFSTSSSFRSLEIILTNLNSWEFSKNVKNNQAQNGRLRRLEGCLVPYRIWTMIGLAQDRPLSIWWTLHFQPCCEKRKKSLNYRKSKKTKSDFVEKRFESDQMLELISKFIHLSLSQNNLSAVRSVLRSLSELPKSDKIRCVTRWPPKTYFR